MKTPLEVLIIVDKEDRSRGQFWQTTLRKLQNTYKLETNVCLRSLADELVKPLMPDAPVLVQEIENSDVLILNWDVINGDPEFGADLTQKWFEYRWPWIRSWLTSGDSKKGHILIVEGQAVLGLPSPSAYAAVLGPGEVALSGPADPWKPDPLGLTRTGDRCRTTRALRRIRGCEDLEILTANGKLTFKKLFPESAGRLLPEQIQQHAYNRMLYRGWFQRRFRRGTLNWVVYARRARRWPLNHATLIGAKVDEKGIIFATTMWLSATGQLELIKAMLESSSEISKLPDPGRARRWIGKYLPRSAASLSSALIMVVVPVNISGAEVIVPWGTGLIVFIFFDSLQVLWRKTRLAARAIRGL